MSKKCAIFLSDALPMSESFASSAHYNVDRIDSILLSCCPVCQEAKGETEI